MRKRDKLKYLRKQKELLQKGWCKKVYAKTIDNIETPPNCDDAAQWCLTGSIFTVFDINPEDYRFRDTPRDDIKAILEIIKDNIPPKYKNEDEAPVNVVIDYNDRKKTRKCDIIRLINKCIRSVENSK